MDFDPAGPLPPSAVPLLVVEVHSPSNPAQDLAVKRGLYERLGVPAYWIVDPEGPSVLALRSVGGGYETEAEVSSSHVFRAEWRFPVRVVIDELQR